MVFEVNLDSNAAAELVKKGLDRVGTSDFVSAAGFLIAPTDEGNQFWRGGNRRVFGLRLGEGGSLHRLLQSDDGKFWGQELGNGSSGPIDISDELLKLYKAALTPVADQVAAAGFRPFASSGDTAIYTRTKTTRWDVDDVILVTNDTMTGPLSRVREVNHAQRFKVADLKILGVSERTIRGRTKLGLRVTNGMVEFTWPEHWAPYDIVLRKELTLADLRVAPVARTEQPDGFVVGGENSPTAIRGLRSLNGVPIGDLERGMRPRQLSTAGFLGQDESLIDLLDRDNDAVSQAGLTHADMAQPLKLIFA